MSWTLPSRNNQMLSAILSAQPSIQFTPAGVILEANDAFLDFMGYRLGEIQTTTAACGSYWLSASCTPSCACRAACSRPTPASKPTCFFSPKANPSPTFGTKSTPTRRA